MFKNIALIGSSGAIGHAMVHRLATSFPNAQIHAVSRSQTVFDSENVLHHVMNYKNENSLEETAQKVSLNNGLDLIFLATGILHNERVSPERSLNEINSNSLEELFWTNTIFPTLVAKHFLPKLNKDTQSIFAALSARVGSISDNRLGGWYGYRASKAALNMILKTASIEMKRKNRNAIVVGIHPGTVESPLSKPFKNNIPAQKLFTPELSAEKILQVLLKLTPQQTGRCFAWDGTEIEP